MVIEEAVDPDGAALEPEEFVGVRQGAVIVQAAHDAAAFVVDSVFVPERQEHLEELVVDLAPQIGETQACQV